MEKRGRGDGQGEIEMAIQKGSRVKLFDHRLYEDDRSTPLNVTMKKAMVVEVYRERKGRKYHFKYSKAVADVRFDYRPDEISRGHFVDQMELIEQNLEAGAKDRKSSVDIARDTHG